MSSFNIGFVIFPDLTQLDFTGPLQVFSRLPQSATHIVAKSEVPVPSDCGLGLVPTHTFANCPPLDLICVPAAATGSFMLWAIAKQLSSSIGKRLLRNM
jgi:cyclohexyl-isocyanide hydratase